MFRAALADPIEWTAPVTLSDPHNVQINATGAHFQTGNDILMFDLNGRADARYVDNESRQNFAWIGGRFTCTIASPTKATAFRLLGMRHARLEPEDFGLTGGQNGFYRDIITGGKDTVYIGNYKTYDVEFCSIEIPPWSAVGGPLLLVIEKVHASLDVNDAQFIRSSLPLADSVIRDVSCNLGSGLCRHQRRDRHREDGVHRIVLSHKRAVFGR